MLMLGDFLSAILDGQETVALGAGGDSEAALADVAMKRGLIDIHGHNLADDLSLCCDTCGEIDFGEEWCLTLRTMAHPYEGQSRFRSEWSL